MKKICYCIESLYNSGGMERVLSVVADLLVDGFDVSIVTMKQEDKPYYFPVSQNVHLYDLGVTELVKKCDVKNRLDSFLKSKHFDVVVSLGGLDLSFLHSMMDGSKKIVWFHFAIDIAKTTWVGPNPNLVKKIKAQLQTWRRIYYARKYDRIVVISKADLKEWMKYTNKAELIYNPVTIAPPQQTNRMSKCVISVGRLDFQKGYDFLIDAWKIVAEKHSDWHLDIYGEGSLRGQLQAQIVKLNLSDAISLRGRVANIEKEYANHSIYVMSSRAEGFGLVLLEAALCGLPLIAFDCPSGPSEIIEDGENGFLINKVGDVHSMADKICLLIENASLRNRMGEKAIKLKKDFSVSVITKQWISLLNNM